jgi:membrane protein
VIGLTTSSHLMNRARTIETLPFLGTFILECLPFIVLSFAFALFYQLMPNTKVRWRAAMVGGIVGGSLWILNNKLSVVYISSVVNSSKIYGSLSIIPLFLIGLYFSWLILLFGAQVAYAFQNRQSYLQEKQAEGVNQRGREFVALRIMTRVAQSFKRGERPPGVNSLAAVLGVPTRLVSQISRPLIEAQLLVEVLDEETGYAPARPLDQITAHDILQALRVGKGQELETCDDSARSPVRGKFDRIYEAEREIAGAVTLESLVREASEKTGPIAT